MWLIYAISYLCIDLIYQIKKYYTFYGAFAK